MNNWKEIALKYQSLTKNLVDRWNSTEGWHGRSIRGIPVEEFRQGEIHVTTGFLADLSRLDKLVKKESKKK